jgi:putative salt-induced outer membrane protein YdiY
MKGRARKAALAVALTVPAAAAGQDPAPPQLRVHLECNVCGATLPATRDWLVWSDSAVDVHVRVGLDGAANGDAAAGRFVIALDGRGLLEGLGDVLHFTAPPAASAAEQQAALLHMVELGLVRFAAATPVGARLRVGIGVAPDAARDAAASERLVREAAREARDARSARREQREQKRWAAGLDLGFSGSSGNSDFMALTSGVRVRHLQTNRFRLDWSASFRYGESRGAVAARHTQSKLDFDLGPEARVAPYISMSGERDPFRRIDLRGRGGTGVRLALHKDADGEANVRAGVLYTHERFSSEAAREPRSDGMWSFKFTGNRQLFSSIRVENTSSFDPVVGNLGDYNLDVTSKVSTRITRRVALTVSHTYAYDATPVESVQPTDQRFQTGLTLDF